MLVLFLQSIYLMLPAYAAIIAPVFVRKVRFLDVPIDFGKRINGKPIIGRHKTYRGYFFGIFAAGVVVLIQMLLSTHTRVMSLVDYASWNAVAVGLMLGFLALLGDTIKSFFKRRIGIPEGKDWRPFDQIDYTLLCGFYLISIGQEIQTVMAAIISSGTLHYIVVKMSIAVGIR
jgi:CDP-2,3-bis-(O-geranylgeranyl)-sn-glycerol synthase